ncbi:MAG: phosphate signaling complex protein PhoU [Pseudomonadota bacterium]
MDLNKSNFSSHISQQFNQELEELKTHILSMGGLVENQVANAVTSLVDADAILAEQVRDEEVRINSLEISIDEECNRILALRHPAASDLRMVIGISKAITDLERIGDEANKVAKLALGLMEEGGAPNGYIQIRHIGNLVREMLRNALDAFARFDVASALSVAQQDRSVDLEYEAAIRLIVTYMMEDPRSISRELKVIWALRALERIGDHARNICEHVIYVVKGKDIRHRNLDIVQQQLLE